MTAAIIIFVACTLLNVVLATIKSVMTIKGSKASAAVWNALSFGLYAYIVILTANAPITTFWKVFITASCNLVGVYGVKLVEERMRKDKMMILVNGHAKARALQAAIEGAVNHMWTISALQMHEHGIIVSDEDAADELKVSTYKYFKDIESDQLL